MRKAILPFFLVILIAFILIAGFAVSEPYFEESWKEKRLEGTWGIDLIVVYEDGTEESLKLLRDNLIQSFIFSVYHGKKKITYIKRDVSAKASGTGYDKVKIDRHSFDFDVKAEDERDFVVKKESFKSDIFSPRYKDIPVDGKWHKIIDNHYVHKKWFAPDKPGTYYIHFTPTELPRYSLDGGKTWKTATRPDSIGITITVKADKTFSIVFSQTQEVE